MSTEPARLFGLINAAIVATLAILSIAGVDQMLVGAITAAVSAWVAVAGEIVRARVTPCAPRDDDDDGAGEVVMFCIVVVAVISALLIWNAIKGSP